MVISMSVRSYFKIFAYILIIRFPPSDGKAKELMKGQEETGGIGIYINVMFLFR